MTKYTKFHPIITQGGAVVNAAPDQVVVESYVRGVSMEAIMRESKKINRAKVQCGMLICLLENEAQMGRKVLAENKREFPSIAEYLAQADSLCIDRQAVTYHEDGSVSLNF